MNEKMINHATGDQIEFLQTAEETNGAMSKFMFHAFWNAKEEPVRFIAEIYPPINIEKGIRLIYELSKEGKVNKRNIQQNPFYTLLLMAYFDSYFASFLTLH